MKLTADTDKQTLLIEQDGKAREMALYSKESFEEISRLWLINGWNQKHIYNFSWLGRPIIQLPEDLMRVQEVIYRLQPDIIIETGVAHGGSLIFYASLCKVLGKGKVVGVDIEIRPHNREAIEAHELFSYITLIEGSSTDTAIVEEVKSHIPSDGTVLVLLDSDHSYNHVTAELEAYSGFVTPGSYIVSTDGIMQDLADVPRGEADWGTNNPAKAARDFVAKNTNFVIEQPEWPFSESDLTENLTHWPDAWIKRIS